MMALTLAVLFATLPFETPVPPSSNQAAFALVIGVNEPIDPELKPLRFADDDAARYFDLFRGLGMRVFLLTAADDNTRRLHPQAVAEARLPLAKDLDAALEELTSELTRAKQNGMETLLYFVYAGHGNVREGQGYISLADRRLFGQWLEQHIVQQTGADRVHFIIDACHSYFLAFSRGPGGERHEVQGFSQLETFARHDHVGLLLAASGSWETHEWAAIQAGVFSHEVRSGLYGAADADGDGRVSYREIGAFIDRANAAIPNERFRPHLFARPPRADGDLLDLRASLGRRVEVTGQPHGHFLVEDTRGVRLADFHNRADQSVWLVRPPSLGRIYVRNTRTQREFLVPGKREVVQLRRLTARRPRTAGRGAAHHAFSRLFEQPFDATAVDQFNLDVVSTSWQRIPAWSEEPEALRPTLGWAGVGLGFGLAGMGVGFSMSALELKSKDDPSLSHDETRALNADIDERNRNALIAYAAGGVLFAAGLTALLWPEDKSSEPAVSVTPMVGGAVLNGRF